MIQIIFNKVILLSVVGTLIWCVLNLVFLIFGKLFLLKQKYYLLFIPLLLYLIPINIWSSFNVEKKEDMVETFTISESRFSQIVSHDVMIGSKNQDHLVKYSIKDTGSYDFVKKDVLNFLPYFWLTGVVILAINRIKNIIRFRRLLKQIELEPTREMLEIYNNSQYSKLVRLKCFDGIASPFTVGILKPTIFIPNTQLCHHEFNIILSHEMIHIKRYDLFLKALADFAQTIHFFNPFIYILKSQISSYCELSCDEAISTKMDIEQKKEYIELILALMKKSNTMISSDACLYNNEKKMERRMIEIMKLKRRSKFTVGISVIIIVVLLISSIALANALNVSENEITADISLQFDDQKLQQIVENEVGKNLHPISDSTIIFINPNNGQVLAGIGNALEPFEPMSTFKLITSFIALKENKVTVDEKFNCVGSTTVDNHTFRCWKVGGHGEQTLSSALLLSAGNPILIDISQRIGTDRFYKNYELLGLNNNSESKSSFYSYNEFNELELALTSIGQGFSVSPLQIVSAVSAMVNGGNLYQPYIDENLKLDFEIDGREQVLLNRVLAEGDSNAEVQHFLGSLADEFKIVGIGGSNEFLPRGSGNYGVSYIAIGPGPIENTQVVGIILLKGEKDVTVAENTIKNIIKEFMK
ncbi:MAG: hypothetical protein GX962_03795 [Epulopiscium sp.]|nr:hypothetical protein [Candidatus Epulonipiscium sp.]